MSDETSSLGSPFEHYESAILARLEGYVKSGISLLKEEEAFRGSASAVKVVKGQHEATRSKALSRTHDNRTRKNVYELASALTDVRPVWSYSTENEDFKAQAGVYGRVTKMWWRNRSCDRALLSAILWAAAVGSSYLLQQFNPDLPGGGDIEMIPLDGRDVLPIGAVYSDSIQDWQGVIVRQPVNASWLISQHPTKKAQIEAAIGQSWFDGIGGVKRSSTNSLTVLQHLQAGGAAAARANSPTTSYGGSGHSAMTPLTDGPVDLFRIYVKDYSRNTGPAERLMGAGESYEYTVKVGERLYPRGRCILATKNALLKDGPNPYWHGMFPLSRLTLLPWPDTILGLSVLSDVQPLQHAINEWVRGTEDGVNQWIRRSVIADATAMAETKLRALDSRASGQQIRINPTAGKGFEYVDGPTFPAWWMEWGAFLTTRLDENMGVRGLQQVLAQAKQIPSKDTLDEIKDALSPLLKIMSRSVETTLGEAATLFRWNVDQFFPAKRRFQMLGQDGVTIEDSVDFDPGNMIPTEGIGDLRSTFERALDYGKQFIFSVQPNTLLNVGHATQKLMNLQLFRSNAIDLETMLKSQDMQNVGKLEGETIIEKMVDARRKGLQPGAPPELVAAQTAAQILQAQQLMAQMAMTDPNGTAQMMGGGAGAPPGGGAAPPQGAPPTSGTGPQGGRPPSGQAPPTLVQKDGGARTTISESGS